MQKNHEYYTTSAQYYGKDAISDDEYFLTPGIVSQVPHASAYTPTAHYGLKNDSMYGSDKYEDHQQNFRPTAHYGLKNDSMYGSDKYEDHQQNFRPTAHYGLKSDSMYGSDKYEDHQLKNFHTVNRHQNKGHHGVPEVNKKVHFVEHVEFDKNGKHQVHDKEISVDVEADGFIQKKHQTFDKWETFKGY